jgi:hypothetical protein
VRRALAVVAQRRSGHLETLPVEDVLREGPFTFRAQPSTFAPACASFGPGERSAPYAIQVTRDGYMPSERTILVFEDGCHVITEHVDVALPPIAPAPP